MNANEVLQWVALGVLLLAVLGLYRQLAVFLTSNSPDFEFSNGPPIQKRLPDKVLQALFDHGLSRSRRGSVLLAFVTEGCLGCQRLLGSLDGGVPDGVTRGGITPVIVALNPSRSFVRALRATNATVVEDDGTLWAMCNIQATPSLVAVNPKGVVTAKGVSPDVSQFISSRA